MMLPVSAKGEPRIREEIALRDQGVIEVETANVRICMFHDVMTLSSLKCRNSTPSGGSHPSARDMRSGKAALTSSFHTAPGCDGLLAGNAT
jgi:hypothetical protein